LAEYADNDCVEAVTEFVRKHSRLYDTQNDQYKREPFASDVRAGKNSAIYNAHSYHTKVPPEGIVRFIVHYTEPGDLVLDPFCGTGMTGVAAIGEGRNAVLADISPIASFISYNYCTPFDAAKFIAAEKQIRKEMETLTSWLYETQCARCGRKSIVEYTVWSEELQCPRCNQSFPLWESLKDEVIAKEFRCPTCGKELDRAKCRRVGARPVKIFYDCPACKREQKQVSGFDLDRLREIQNRFKAIYDDDLCPKEEDKDRWPVDDNGVPLWFPTLPIMLKGENWGDTWRSGYHDGMTRIEHFYTKRNLWALARLWYLINKVKDERTKRALQFVFTSFNPSFVSKLTRYNFGKRGNSPLSGTLYIPSFSVERNVSSIWKNKKKAQLDSSTFIRHNGEVIVTTQSSTNLENIPSDCVDYVFTDPPFGSNLMYSELNFIWESWLGFLTNVRDEAIINKSQGKGIFEYKDLMTKSFKEIYRVLKPGRWMTMVFHNSDGKVWQAIQEGLSEAGFVIGMIGIFDKKQRSFKQVTSSGAVGYDVVVNCYKPKATIKNGIEGKTTKDAIIGFLADYLQKSPLTHGDERTARMLHSKTIGFFMLQNRPLEKLSFEDFQIILKKNFRSIDGFWYLPYQRPKVQGQRRLFGYVSNEAEAIEWLEELLRSPRKYGDIAPEFFKALGPQKLQKNLQDLLQDSFVEEGGTWRNPTTFEKEGLIKRLTNKTAREVTDYLKGGTEYTPTDDEICAWIEFCYNNGLYQEGSQLFNHIDEKKASPEVFKRIKKVAEICKLKSWEGS
jgi:DNA modification methylase/predicted RNA-binding Zn-ribbon protein involved in translation (DUF1610 family)